MVRPLLAMLIAAFLAACRGEGGSAEHAAKSSAGVSATLHGRVLYDGDVLGRPQVTAIVGDRLVVTDAGGGKMILLLDRSTGRLLAQSGSNGRGPGEFLSIWSVQPGAEPATAWLFDPAQGRLTLVNLDSLAAGARNPVQRILVLRTDLLPMDARWLADTLIVSTGLFSAGRVALFDSTGRVRRFAGPLPPSRPGVPPNVTQHAYSGTLALHPHHTAFAIATRQADRVEIYAADGSLRRVARGPRRFEPQYEMRYRGNQPAMATGEDLRFGYVDLAAAGDRLFALYSGHTRAERPGRANFGDEVHVFDWSGRLLARYRLDQPALTLAVDAPSRTLYAVRHDPTPAVVSYTLSAGAF